MLLSDHLPRTTALMRGLRGIKARFVIDVMGSAGPRPRLDGGVVRAIVSDVPLSEPAKIDWLRGRLAERLPGNPPYFCMLHRETSQGLAQAGVLGAAKTITPSGGEAALEEALLGLFDDGSGRGAFMKAETAFASIFVTGRAGGGVSPELISSCAGFVKAALADLKVRDLLEIVWRFDDAIHQHCMLVAGLAAAFAVKLGFRADDAQRLTAAALLHDVGKSRIPLAILNKPGQLTAAERATINTHPVIGFDMLRGLGHSDEMLRVVRSHHEALDGSGYPDGLSGSEIPDLVRLVTICDIFGALIERRPYRPAMSCDRAYDLLASMEGKVDLDLVRAFRPVAVEAFAPAQHAAAG